LRWRHPFDETERGALNAEVVGQETWGGGDILLMKPRGCIEMQEETS